MLLRARSVTLALAASVLALAAGGCDESDAASLRLKINKGGPSGEIAASVLASPGAPTAAETLTSGGVTWANRAAVTLSRGTFADIAKLTFGEVHFKFTPTGSQSILEVFMPRGASVKWPGLLASETEAERSRARAVLAPDDADSKLGKVVKITIDLPGKVSGSDSSLPARGLSASYDQQTATFIVPIDLVMQEGAPIRWTVKWD